MNDKETADLIRKWVKRKNSGGVSHFSWPTDMAGYEQHILFVNHRNNNWAGGTDAEFDKFCLDYADGLTTTKDQS